MSYIKCSLSDAELVTAVKELISRLCKDPRAWQMSVPPDFNRDSDMLICELANRFKTLSEAVGPLKTAAEEFCAKVEDGRAKSVESYKSFKLALTKFEQ